MAERAINSDMTVVSAAAAMANSNVGNPPSSLPVPSTTLSKAYGSVEISLENCLLPKERLSAATPSSCDGLDEQTEMDLRILGCELIQTAGILLRLPQVAMATGQVLFHRFYYSKSFVRQPMEITAMGCICLASKVEEAPRRIRDVISVFNHIKQVRGGKPIQPVLLDQGYIDLKNQVIKAERRVLKELGFCVHVKHPHKIVVMYLQILTLGKNKPLVQLAWNYMNDSLRTDVFVRFSPETIACACIYLSARKLGIVLPKRPAWYVLFGCVEADLKDICIRILRLYNRAKPDADLLDRTVSELQQSYQQQRLKSKLTPVTSATAAAPTPTGAADTAARSVAPASAVSKALPEPNSTFTPPPISVTTSSGAPATHVNSQALSVESVTSTPTSIKVDEKQCVMTKKSHSVESRGSRSRSRSASVEKHGHHQHQDGEKERRHGKSRHGHHGHHRHHHKKRSRSRSPPPLPPGHMGSDQKRRDREGREHKEKSGRRRSRSRDREPRDKDRDYKYRSKNKEDKYREPRDKEAPKERRGHRDRSLSRDRRR